MKIIFLGTPKFGAIILEQLAKTKYKPFLVITEPDKSAGRKQELKKPECKIIAEKYGIPVEQPVKVSSFNLQVSSFKPDLAVVAAYGQILTKEILEIPKHGCLNVHPSLLPKYRGPSPIQNTILNRDKEAGATIILMDKKVDHGPIISNLKFKIQKQFKILNYKTLEKKLAEIGADLLIDTIPKWVAEKIKPVPQNDSAATFTKIIKKEDGKISWNNTAQEIEAKIKAFSQWPGAYSFWNGKRIKILSAGVKVLPNLKNYDNGKVLFSPENELLVACKKDFLLVDKLQLEGKKPMSSKEFLKGNKNIIKTILK